ncbi:MULTISPECIES: OmpH family outer membrane protein [unclassified Acinetobacter]|uniref:OmpH family outer membrane protein n=1 Tax=unclassified Acinetobacter TaxID=196816 RepID=UPI00293498E2|nr:MULTISPECIES: OmpH family outer membrane protein [unclassified Acinetobacter]WOE31892.1 OmpH family outer membrane protein [Acinetobacter sp. SAAs470]WOE37359.1 OmpH family outer membrane protein [Acinetobacter sp. SAAs474]
MKKLILSMLVGLSFTAVQAADIGVVDIAKVVQSSSYLKQQESSLQQSVKPQTTQIEQLQKELTALQQKAQTAKLTDAEKKKMTEEFQAKVTQLEKLQQDVQAKVQKSMQATNQNFETQVKTVAEQLRKENKLDAVLNKTAVLAFDPSSDLTDKMVQKVNAMK